MQLIHRSREEKRHHFVEKLNNFGDIAHEYGIKMVKYEDDGQFLNLQRQRGRYGFMCGIDRRSLLIEGRIFLYYIRMENFYRSN